VASFVHLTPEPRLALLLRNGIRMSRASSQRSPGVFAMPVMRSFYASHQWLRELKSSGSRTIAAVYFRLPDAEPVWVGHYSSPLQLVSASSAIAIITNASSAEGFQVLVPRRIEAREITRSRTLSQVLGWRYFPGAHGTPPCPCPFCNPRGTIKARRIRSQGPGGDGAA